MFNKNFNLTAFIKTLPMNLRKSALLSLIGSINYKVAITADNMCVALLRDGYDLDELKTLDARDVKALLTGPETGPSNEELPQVRKLWNVRNEYFDLYEHTTFVSTGRKISEHDTDSLGRPIYGTMAATIKTITGEQRERDIKQDNIKLAVAAGIEVTAEKIAARKARRKERDTMYAQQRAARLGMTEWIIDKLFSHVTDDEDDENYSQLDADYKELLCNKFLAWTGKALQQIEDNIFDGVTRDDALGAADRIILLDVIKKFPDLMSNTKAKAAIKKAQAPAPAKPKARRAVKPSKQVTKPAVQRAPAPTQASKVTETLANGFKLTHAVEPTTT